MNMDRVDSLSSADFNVAEIDWLLNEAQLIFIKQRMSALSNPKRKGFEATQKRIDDLSTIVIKFPEQAAITPILDQGVYEVPLSSLKYKYLQLIDGFCDYTDTANCTKKIVMRFIQHDDYREALRDPFNAPSYEFILYNFGRSSTDSTSSVYLYPPVDGTIDAVYLEYIKYPERVSYGNYAIYGVTYPQATLELPEHTHSEIVDIACQLAALNVQNPEYVQLKTAKIAVHE